MKKISIITINKNNAVGLEKTIQSVISQSYTNIEYIIVDGASRDGSVDVIKKYADSISGFISETDNGLYNAMNKGIKMASGDYIFFLNIIKNPATPVVEYYKRYQHDIPPQPALFVKRELFSKVNNFDESYRIIADVVFVSRLFSDKNLAYKHIDEIISIFDTTGISSQHANQEMIYLERRRFIETEFPQYLQEFEKVYQKSFLSKLKKRISGRLFIL